MDNYFEYEHIPYDQENPLNLKKVEFKNYSEYVRPRHFHQDQELILFEKVRGQVWINENEYQLKDYTLVYIPSFYHHIFKLKKPGSWWYISQFGAETLQQIMDTSSLSTDPVIKPVGRKEFEKISKLFEWYNQARQSKSSRGFEFEIFRLILKWVQMMATSHKGQFSKSVINRNKFQPLIDYLDKKEVYQLSVGQASKICGFSRSQFLGLFKKSFHFTYNEFLTERKMNQAQVLLTRTDSNMSEIAERLNFIDSAYFAKVFKKHFGQTPSSFKNAAEH